MASFVVRQPSRRWTVEECAVFSARKEYELIKLLATDKRALATARRLGCFASAGHPHSHPLPPAASAARATRPPKQQADVVPRCNARQRRSALRSAKRHRSRQLVIRSRILALLFCIRLKRRVRLRRDLHDLDALSDTPPEGGTLLLRGPAAKRGPGGPSSSSSGSEPESDSSEPTVAASGRPHTAKRWGGSARAAWARR